MAVTCATLLPHWCMSAMLSHATCSCMQPLEHDRGPALEHCCPTCAGLMSSRPEEDIPTQPPLPKKHLDAECLRHGQDGVSMLDMMCFISLAALACMYTLTG